MSMPLRSRATPFGAPFARAASDCARELSETNGEESAPGIRLACPRSGQASDGASASERKKMFVQQTEEWNVKSPSR